jgi:predicted transcriptional regulator/ribosomal protein L37AE/L43A
MNRNRWSQLEVKKLLEAYDRYGDNVTLIKKECFSNPSLKQRHENSIIKALIGIGKLPRNYLEEYKDNWKRNYYEEKNEGFTNELKEEIKKRDEYKCKICQSTEKLQVHHIVDYLYSRNNDQSNLILICKKCHWCVHSGSFTKELAETYASNIKDLGHKPIVMENTYIKKYAVSTEELSKLISESKNIYKINPKNEILFCVTGLHFVILDYLVENSFKSATDMAKAIEWNKSRVKNGIDKLKSLGLLLPHRSVEHKGAKRKHLYAVNNTGRLVYVKGKIILEKEYGTLYQSQVEEIPEINIVCSRDEIKKYNNYKV